MLPHFQISETGRLISKFIIRYSLKIPSHPKHTLWNLTVRKFVTIWNRNIHYSIKVQLEFCNNIRFSVIILQVINSVIFSDCTDKMFSWNQCDFSFGQCSTMTVQQWVLSLTNLDYIFAIQKVSVLCGRILIVMCKNFTSSSSIVFDLWLTHYIYFAETEFLSLNNI